VGFTPAEPMSQSPFIFTICDAGSTKVEALRDSLKGNLFVLECYSPTLGNLSKIFKTRDFLENATELKDDTIVIFLDAYDVLCVRYDLPGIIADFLKTGQDLITGAESIFCHHRSEVLPFFLEKYGDQPARYLNSGFIIAYKWAYLRMLNHIVNNFVEQHLYRHNNCDQRAISTFMLHNSSLNLIKMEMDSRRHFCHTHTYDDNPLKLQEISSYFVHVTWLALDIQTKAYETIKKNFLA
jgi:hypothetical protein